MDMYPLKFSIKTVLPRVVILAFAIGSCLKTPVSPLELDDFPVKLDEEVILTVSIFPEWTG